MSEVCVDYLESYRKFFDRFTSSVDPNDQLPVKVAGYNLLEHEIVGAVGDWALQYLEQRKCPPFLLAHLVRKVIEEVRNLSKADPISCGYRSQVGDWLPLKLMHVCVNQLVEVCAQYQDNAKLSSLPPPCPLPPVTACAIKNSRRSMEDRHVIIHDFHTLFNIKGYGPASYYAVFDGHNGQDAAIYSVSHLHQYLAESSHYPQDPRRALHDACIKTDSSFSTKAHKENLHGGTTAVFALLRPRDRKLYVVWLGDSQAVIVRRGCPHQIVRPHKPDRTDERDRIESLGGTVLYWGAWRVNGQLAVSRAIGDVEYKPYVTAEPDMEEITLDGTEDFLILACDGLWDFVTEAEATSAVYKQLQENPEDLEAVSQRLVALGKDQSSQDNISVVVVFLAEPREVAKRCLMETASANPFVGQNGADLFNGQRPHPRGFEDNEDFGPETDVDMVDDVLLSPAIAAAKALVELDDLERQRRQLSDFDDPADHGRDTPTPPAHEVASNVNEDNLAESGGEDSEEEWNYIPGTDSEPSKDKEDMSSQLNPDAAEFVPVSPTRPRPLMMSEAMIAASSPLPSDLHHANGPKHGDEYFQRDNFSSLCSKGKEFNLSSTCNDEFITKLNPSEDVPFDKTEAVQKMEEKVTSSLLEKANALSNNEFSSNPFEATNIFGNSDPMTTSIIDLTTSSEPDELIPGTPKSTAVEAPTSPDIDSVSPCNQEVEGDLMVEAPLTNNRLIDNSEEDGFITEHRRSPPIDLSFKPIQSFSDTNPFGALQTPSVITPLDQPGIEAEFSKEEAEEKVSLADNIDLLANTSSSFISIRQHDDTVPFNELESPKEDLQFIAPPVGDITASLATNILQPEVTQEQRVTDKLEDSLFHEDNEVVAPPFANSSTLEAELTEAQVAVDDDLFPEENEVVEETSFISKQSDLSKIVSSLGNVDLDSTLDFEKAESLLSNIENDEKQVSSTEMEECSLAADIDRHDVMVDDGIKTLEVGENKQTSFLCETESVLETVVQPCENEKILFDFEEQKTEELKVVSEMVSKLDSESKEMKLEFESHISSAKPTSDDLKEIDEGFEVISKEELKEDVEKVEQSLNLTPSVEPEVARTESYQTLTPAEEPKLVKKEEYITTTENLVIDSKESSLQITKETSEEMIETKLSKIESIQSQVVTETLITNLEEKSEVPPISTPVADKTDELQRPTTANLTDLPSEVAALEQQIKVTPTESVELTENKVVEESREDPGLSVVTPPPTPAPGLDQATAAEKTDLLATAAAVVAAGVGATVGAAVVADKKAAAVGKKPASGVKKPMDSAPKAPLKSVPTKAPAPPKPAAAKPTTSRPAGTTTKPTTTTTTTKLAATKTTTSLTAPKKPSTGPTTAAKTVPGAAPKPTSTTAPKPSAMAAQKQPPKQLTVNKTAPVMKSTSKPSTPTSKPTTPTTPKSPMVKSDVIKSPPKPTRPTTTTRLPTDKAAEKKNLMNGDIKPLVKKPATTTAAKLPAKPSAPAIKSSLPGVKSTVTAKPSVPATKTAGPAKPSAAKTSAPPTKPAPIKRPTTGEDKSKPAVNGKIAPKTISGVKKTDTKVIGKATGKSDSKTAPVKKHDVIEQLPSQESEVTTSNLNGHAEPTPDVDHMAEVDA